MLLLAQPKKAEEDEEGVETTFSDYESAGGNEPLRKNRGKVGVFLMITIVVIRSRSFPHPILQDSGKDTSSGTSKQQNAVSVALAAGVPAGPAGQQRRSVESSSSSSYPHPHPHSQ